MTQLAVHGRSNGAPQLPAVPLASSAMLTLHEVWEMAGYVAESQLFPVKSPQQAFTLMMLAQSEGLHPIQALKRYDIIDGKPCLKSAAIQAEFQRLGGVIEIGECTATEANATFSHPTLQPRPVAMKTTFEHYKKIGLTSKKNWTSDPEAMLWWRLVSKGVRRIYPGIVVGIYSVEEVQDTIELESPSFRQVESASQATAAVVAADVPVSGFQGPGFDTRPYRIAVADGIAWVNDRAKEASASAFGEGQFAAPVAQEADAHLSLINRAVQLGRIAELPATKAAQFAALKSLYANDRDWVRSELQTYLDAVLEKAHDLITERLATLQDAAPQDVDPDEPGSRG